MPYETIIVSFKNYSSTFLEGLKNNVINIRRECKSSSRKSNPAHTTLYEVSVNTFNDVRYSPHLEADDRQFSEDSKFHYPIHKSSPLVPCHAR